MGEIADRIAAEVCGWPGVTSCPHRFGGVELDLGGRELGHLHGDRLADLPFPRAQRDELEMYELALAENPADTIPALDFRGVPTGIDLRRVVETGITPRVNTGIASRRPGVGQIGAGVVRPPLDCFVAALRAAASA